jgi:hypothetical protein
MTMTKQKENPSPSHAEVTGREVFSKEIGKYSAISMSMRT